MAASWGLVSLTEMIGSLGGIDHPSDIRDVVQQAAETVDAEFAVLCTPTDVIHAFGFGPDGASADDLLAMAHSRRPWVDIEAADGPVSCMRTDVEGTDQTLMVGRTGEALGVEDRAFVRAVGRLIGLSTRMRLALDAERSARTDAEHRMEENRELVSQLQERQGLLDRLFRIQRSISHRAPTQEVLDAVSSGALELLGVARVDLRLRDREHPDELVSVSSLGLGSSDAEGGLVASLDDELSGRCVRDGRLVATVVAGAPRMAAPVHVNGEVVGCLTIERLIEAPAFTSVEQDVLLAFAEHASLALQDARAMDAMRVALSRERHRAAHDPLTNLANRATIERELDIRLAEEGPVAVLFVDLDRFKLTNDTRGHQFGDRVLTTVADRLRTSVRGGDVVGRLAGDEFVVVCSGMSDIGAIELAERIQDVIRRPILDGPSEHVITASVGIAGAMSSESAEQLIANADLAMYRAKQAGRARIEVFDHDFRAAVEARLAVGDELRQAVDASELVVHLQPVVRLPERRVVSFEALVRWAHPTRGTVGPDDFVPLAEETGLIADIDRAVVDEVLRLMAMVEAPRPVAVNVSARTFADPTLAGWLATRLAHHEVPASLVILEVTETVLMEATEAAASQLAAIRSLGVSVMIDDFGTGYSALAYLQTFDVDGVKIDREFTAGLGRDRRADAIVAAVLHMADALDLLVVVEGIETDDQVARIVELRDRTGDVELHGQGFLFGRPEDGERRLRGFIAVPPSSSSIALG